MAKLSKRISTISGGFASQKLSVKLSGSKTCALEKGNTIWEGILVVILKRAVHTERANFYLCMLSLSETNTVQSSLSKLFKTFLNL